MTPDTEATATTVACRNGDVLLGVEGQRSVEKPRRRRARDHSRRRVNEEHRASHHETPLADGRANVDTAKNGFEVGTAQLAPTQPRGDSLGGREGFIRPERHARTLAGS